MYGHHSYGGYNQTPFRQFDKNHDGLITQADFRIAAAQNGYGYVGQEVMNSVFRTMDKNHNGYLDAHEVYNGYHLLSRLYGNNYGY